MTLVAIPSILALARANSGRRLVLEFLSADTLLVGLTCRGNGRSGISVGGASQAEIVASLVGSNGEAQVRTEGKSHTILVNCDLVEHDVVPKLDRRGGEVRVEGNTNLP